MELINFCSWTKIGATLPTQIFFLGVDDVYKSDLTRFGDTNWRDYRTEQIIDNGADLDTLGDECVSKDSNLPGAKMSLQFDRLLRSASAVSNVLAI